ncbi:glycosyltransferase [Marinicella marina]|uniref:glycosyltransferase n=1 Tax=Marinicella marina TaxID=2996016 RepID=UPI002260CCCD|nr:glycosyltransferase [Marinicella marina]
MKSLKIMQVVPALEVGGVERGTVEFAIYLKNMGHQPVVVSAGGEMVKELTSNGVQHITLNVNRKSLSSLLSVKKLRALMLKLEIDLVHARSRIPAWLCFFALKKMTVNKPHFVTTLHGLHSVSKYSAIMAKGDRVIAVSAAAKAYLLKYFDSELKHQPVVINRGIDPQFQHGYQAQNDFLQALFKRHPQLSTSKKVLLPGRLTRVKGIENMIPWLQQGAADHYLLLTAAPDESKYSQRVTDLLAKHQVSDKVIWLGVQRQMPDLYAAVDVVVSTNNKPESFGRTVLEALTIGTPVVGFAIGGVKDILQDIFPQGAIQAGDSQAMAQRIEAFLQQSPVVPAHQSYANQSMFDQTLAVYNELINVPN